eukprot:Opistho-2@92046
MHAVLMHTVINAHAVKCTPSMHVVVTAHAVTCKPSFRTPLSRVIHVHAAVISAHTVGTDAHTVVSAHAVFTHTLLSMYTLLPVHAHAGHLRAFTHCRQCTTLTINIHTIVCVHNVCTHIVISTPYKPAHSKLPQGTLSSFKLSNPFI